MKNENVIETNDSINFDVTARVAQLIADEKWEKEQAAGPVPVRTVCYVAPVLDADGAPVDFLALLGIG